MYRDVGWDNGLGGGWRHALAGGGFL
jgi:hypothetical protein